MTRRRSVQVAEPSALAVQAWLSVVRAYHYCDAVLAERLAALDLKVGEHEVLVNLLRAPGITQQQLARRCFAAKSGVSMLVSRMETSGLVQRRTDAVDARVKLLHLTPRGESLARRALAIQSTVVAAMTASADDAELKRIEQSMNRVSATLESMLDVRSPLRRGVSAPSA